MVQKIAMLVTILVVVVSGCMEKDVTLVTPTPMLTSTPTYTPQSTALVTVPPTPILTPAAVQKNFNNSIGIEFVPIPAGEFNMGSPLSEKYREFHEGPVHRVKLAKDFYMGKYEVTQKQWREIMGNNPPIFRVMICLSRKFHGTMFRNLSRNSMRKKVEIITVFPPRLSGNMQLGQGQQPNIRSRITNQKLVIMLGIMKTLVERRIQLVRRSLIPGDSTICTAMCGNGCRIAGMKLTTAHPQTAAHGKMEIILMS